jgi:hypothetical protein
MRFSPLMRRTNSPRYCLLLLWVALWGQQPIARADNASTQIETWGFPVGEELVYRIYWGAVPVGESIVSTSWQEGAEGKLLVLSMRVRSNRAIAAIYPVTIHIESVVCADTFMPVSHTQKRREGRHRTEETVTFDYEEGRARIWSVLRKRETIVELEPGVRDVFSFLYYIRRHPFVFDTKERHRVLADDKIYDLWLQTGDRETSVDSVLHDRVAALEVVPEAAFDGVFRRQGRLEILVSRDTRQLMLQMRASVPVGSIRTVLTEVRGPGADRWGHAASVGLKK